MFFGFLLILGVHPNPIHRLRIIINNNKSFGMKCKLSFYLRFTLIHPCAVGVAGAFRRNMYGREEESRGSQEQVADFPRMNGGWLEHPTYGNTYSRERFL